MPNYESPDWRLPVGDIRYLRQLAQFYGKHKDVLDLEFFFSHVLLPYYDCMWDGLNTDVGHIVYRLSDSVPEEERRRIIIYPSKNGSVVIAGEEKISNPWDSLEDWRKQWERHHPYIPPLMKMLPSPSDISPFNEEH